MSLTLKLNTLGRRCVYIKIQAKSNSYVEIGYGISFGPSSSRREL